MGVAKFVILLTAVVCVIVGLSVLQVGRASPPTTEVPYTIERIGDSPYSLITLQYRGQTYRLIQGPSHFLVRLP